MSRKDDQQCKRSGCQNGGFFHGYCKRHFPEAYGMSWEDYLKNRAFRGEKPHLVAARIKGLDTSQLSQGKVKSVKDQASLAGATDPAPTSPDQAPIIPAASVMFPQELWDRVSELAAIEFRTPDQQVLYMLDGLLNPVTRSRIINEVSNKNLEERMTSFINTSPAIRAAIRAAALKE